LEVDVEKRKFERVPLGEPVVVVDERTGERCVGEAADLSVGGMFIEGVKAPFGAVVTVHLHITGDEAALVLPGVVRWEREHGIGVQFGSLGARETHAITEVIARAAPSRTRERVSARSDVIELDLDDVDLEALAVSGAAKR
jgi:type IV pilus assembly protein PilZ